MSYLIPTLVEIVCLLVAVVALWAARLHWQSHERHIVPGLAFVGLTLALEGAELMLLYLALAFIGPADTIPVAALVLVRALTLFRMGSAVGFWLAMRYSQCDVMTVRSALDAFCFAHAGWMALFKTYARAAR